MVGCQNCGSLGPENEGYSKGDHAFENFHVYIYIYIYIYIYKDGARDSIPNSPLRAHKEQACLE